MCSHINRALHKQLGTLCKRQAWLSMAILHNHGLLWSVSVPLIFFVLGTSDSLLCSALYAWSPLIITTYKLVPSILLLYSISKVSGHEIFNILHRSHGYHQHRQGPNTFSSKQCVASHHLFFCPLKISFYFMCIAVSSACVSVHHRHAVPREDRRGQKTPWSYGQLANRQVLGIAPWSFGKAASAFKP